MVHRDIGGLRGRTFYFDHKCFPLAAVSKELVDGRASQCHLLLSGFYNGLFYVFSTYQNQTVEQLFYFHQPGPFFRAISRAGHLPEKLDRQSNSWRGRIQGIRFRNVFAFAQAALHYPLLCPSCGEQMPCLCVHADRCIIAFEITLVGLSLSSNFGSMDVIILDCLAYYLVFLN